MRDLILEAQTQTAINRAAREAAAKRDARRAALVANSQRRSAAQVRETDELPRAYNPPPKPTDPQGETVMFDRICKAHSYEELDAALQWVKTQPETPETETIRRLISGAQAWKETFEFVQQSLL